MIISYFAKTRETIGRDEDDIEFSSDIISIKDALDYLETLGDEYHNALSNRDILHYALDNEIAPYNSSIAGKAELAIFPPVTGG